MSRLSNCIRRPPHGMVALAIKHLVMMMVALILAAPAYADISFRGAEWNSEKQKLVVKGRGAAAGQQLELSSAATGELLATTVAGDTGRWRFRVRRPSPVPCTVAVEAGGKRIVATVEDAPEDCNGGESPPTVVLSSLTVAGPTSVAEGSSAAFTATAEYSDGTQEDVSGKASWKISPPGIAEFNDPGQLTTGQVDQNRSVTVSASYGENNIQQVAYRNLTVIDSGPPITGTGSHAGKFTTFDGTQTCLTCHYDEALQAHDSVHYQWKGDSSETVGLGPGTAGKLGGINDFCIYPDINWIGKMTNTRGEVVDGGCAKCHAGLGAKPLPAAGLTPAQLTQQLENIDCLVCHSDSYKRHVEADDETGVFRFVPDEAKMAVSLIEAATDITRPSKDSCLNCHTKAGGGNNFKRGDIEEEHRNPTRDFDVHMASKKDGGAGLSCLDCHTSADHKIAGRGSDLRPRELPDEVACTNCHAAAPHHEYDIDKHTARVNCTVCHIPYFAKVAETDMKRDWSAPGDLHAQTGLYEPHMIKAGWVAPEVRFFNGSSYFYQFGDPALPNDAGSIVMSEPLGSVTDAGAKLYAFKRHEGVQPIGPDGRLLPLKIGLFFQSGDIDPAVKKGFEEVFPDETYQTHGFAATERYMGLFHEVAPKGQALACNDCHNGGDRVDFAALGYTPKNYYNESRQVPLCLGCHEDESDEWSGNEFFRKVHEKHVKDKKKNCIECHVFAKAN